MKVVRIQGQKMAPLSIGTTVDNRYEIQGEIGHGGFAVVYRAHDRLTDTDVALKVLSQHLPSNHADILFQRFVREAQVLSELDHANIVAVHGSGVMGQGQPYISMDLLDGCELGEELAVNGAMSPSRAWSLMLPCLEALAGVHEQGVIHKDLKPSNLFLSGGEDGGESLVLLDFGAVALEELPDARLTLCGEMIGTPQYLAPEYILEQEATAAVDVYQMGLILVEMLTGRHAIQATHPYHIFMCHCRGALDIPDALTGSPLGPILKRALAVDPSERYSNAGEFLVALAALAPLDVPDLSSEVAELSDSQMNVFEGSSTALMGVVEQPTVITSSAPTVIAIKKPESAPRPGRTDRADLWVMVSAAAALACGLGAVLAVGGTLIGEAAAEKGRVLSGAVEGVDIPRKTLTKEASARRTARARRWEPLGIERVDSSAFVDGKGPENLTDGNPATVWKARGKGARWIEVSLDRSAVVTGVVLASGWDMDIDRKAKRQRIKLIFDGGEVQYRLVDVRPGLQTVALATPIEARHVRMEFPGVRARSLVGLGELQLWGVALPARVASGR